MSIDVVSPLRQRMIEDMTARKLSAGTQRLHISSCKRFAALPTLTPKASPRNAPAPGQSPYSPAEPSPQPLQSKLTKPAAATKSPERSRHRHQMLHRDFVPWRFSVAGRISASIASSCRAE